MSDTLTYQHGPYELAVVWPHPDAEVCRQAIEFWNARQAVTADSRVSVEARARQLLVVARDAEQTIVAVSTAMKRQVKPLGFPCFHYRTFVGASHRQLWMLSKRILEISYQALNARFLAGHDPDAPGLFMEVQNPRLLKLKDAAWQLSGFEAVYIGNNEHGRHLRVCYFDRARIP